MTARILARLLVWLMIAAAPALACAAPDPSALAAVSPPLGARAPIHLAFRDQHGRMVTLAALAHGEPILLVPVQHACRNLCGLTLAGLKSTISAQGFRPGRDFILVAFGIDPRESAQAAAISADRLGGRDATGISALVGDAASVGAVTRALGYRYTWIEPTQQYAHMAAIAVLTPDGRLVRWMRGLGVAPAELHAAIAAARQGATEDLGAQIRLLCFHFDPATGRYSLAVWTLLRWAAGAAAIVLIGGVALARWRERRSGAAT